MVQESTGVTIEAVTIQICKLLFYKIALYIRRLKIELWHFLKYLLEENI